MIRTITEAEALTLAVRASDDLLTGWRGPIQITPDGDLWTVVAHEARRVTVFHPAVGTLDSFGADYRMSLPLARPEVQAHLVNWLGRGEKCLTPDHLTMAARGSDCPGCDGSGWIRRPANRYAWLTPEAHDGLPDWIRLALIWGSVVRVAAGMGPLKPDVLLPRNGAGRVGYLGEVLLDRHAPLGVDEVRSAETVDAYWLSLGISLIDNAPAGRVIRFEVPHG